MNDYISERHAGAELEWSLLLTQLNRELNGIHETQASQASLLNTMNEKISRIDQSLYGEKDQPGLSTRVAGLEKHQSYIGGVITAGKVVAGAVIALVIAVVGLLRDLVIRSG